MVGNATSKGSARGDAPVGIKGKPALEWHGRVLRRWRRGRDSNPRYPVRDIPVFETGPFNRSGTPPFRRLYGFTER